MAKFDTLTVHAGYTPDATGAVMPAIYATSTYAQPAPGEHTGYEYSRSANPTRTALESTIAELEGGSRGYAFASGPAACSTVLELLDKDSHLIAVDDLYGGTYRLLEKGAQPQRRPARHLRVTGGSRRAGTGDRAGYQNDLGGNPDQPLAETGGSEAPSPRSPKSISLSAWRTIPSLRRICSVRWIWALTWWCTPPQIPQRPLRRGGRRRGGGDNPALAEQLGFLQNAVGGILDPFSSFLTLRGIRTTALRMHRHSDSALRIAQWLESQPQVENVYYPGLQSHPQHELAARQMTRFGGMISVRLKATTPMRGHPALAPVHHGGKLGGVESLISQPFSMTHASIPLEQRPATGITPQLVRLSVGIEDVEDLIADLQQALAE